MQSLLDVTQGNQMEEYWRGFAYLVLAWLKRMSDRLQLLLESIVQGGKPVFPRPAELEGPTIRLVPQLEKKVS